MAISYVGASNIVTSNGAAPGAITPHANTVAGDLLLFMHYSAITGGNETVTPPSGFASIFNGISAGDGLMAAAARFRQQGETSYTASITNHTSSASGESVIEWISTYRGNNLQIGEVSPVLLTVGAHTTDWGPYDSTAIGPIPPGGMMMIVAGRHDDLATVAQNTLSGDGLTWAARTVQETISGADAAMVHQSGLNNTVSPIDPSASYTITGHGASDSATGAGFFFIIYEAVMPEFSKKERDFLFMGAGGVRKFAKYSPQPDPPAPVVSTMYPKIIHHVGG